MLRCVGAWLAAALLLTAALLGLAGLATTEAWARAALCTPELQKGQQALIDDDASALGQKWGLAPDTLHAASANAAAEYSETLAAWWGELFRSEESDTALPDWLDLTQERPLVEAIMADAGFTPSDEHLRRQEARDVVYELDSLVRRTVLPLRPAMAELTLTMLAQRVNLPQLRQFVLMGAGAAAAAGLTLLALLHRAAGSILIGTGGAMALLSVPVTLLNVHEMMLQLSPDAVQLSDRLLMCLGLPWYGAAAMLLLAGLLILKIKDVRR